MPDARMPDDHPDNHDAIDDPMHDRLRAAGARWRDADDAPDAARAARTATMVARPADLTPPSRRRARRGLLASAVAVAAAVVVGGGYLVHGIGGSGTSDDQTAGRPLVGTVWRVTDYGSDHLTEGNPTLLHIAADGALVVDDACTVLGARTTIDGHHLRISGVSSRFRSCVDEYGPTLDRAGVRALHGTVGWRVAGLALILTAGGHPVLRAEAASVPAPTLDVPTFFGATWRLAATTDPAGHRTAVPQKDAPTLIVDGGRLVASDSCNTLNADVTVAGDQVTLGGVSTSAIGCGPSPVVSVVDAVIDGSVTQTVTGTTLTLSKNGAGTLDYTWQPHDLAAVDPAALTGHAWALAAVGTSPTSGEARLSVDARGTYTAKDGCRSFSGTARTGLGSVHLTGVPTSAPASCGSRDQASTVDSFLTAPSGFAVRDGRLLIYGGGGQGNALVFITTKPAPPAPPAPAAPLGAWMLTQVEKNSGSASSGYGAADGGLGARFTVTAGRYRIDERCGSRSGPLRVAARTLTLLPADTQTDHSCLAPTNDTRAIDAAVTALAEDVGWTLRSNQLVLTKGVYTFSFSKQ